MIWDFRIIKKKIKGHFFYEVHRVFYADITKKRPVMIDRTPASIVGQEPIEMLDDVDLMARAFSLPTLYVPELDQEMLK